MSSTDNTSTLQSYVDSAKGAAQNLYGSITGNTGDEAAGKAKQQKGDAEYEASQATAKLGNLTASSSGAITKDHPDRSAGSWNQTVGSAKEFVGGATGSESLKQSGREQNLAGQEQEARGQLSDLASGGADRLTGAVGGAIAGLTGNTVKQAEYQSQHDSGKTRERGAEHDITKQAAARE